MPLSQFELKPVQPELVQAEALDGQDAIAMVDGQAFTVKVPAGIWGVVRADGTHEVYEDAAFHAKFQAVP